MVKLIKILGEIKNVSQFTAEQVSHLYVNLLNKALDNEDDELDLKIRGVLEDYIDPTRDEEPQFRKLPPTVLNQLYVNLLSLDK